MASASDLALIQETIQATIVQNYMSFATLTLLAYDIGELLAAQYTDLVLYTEEAISLDKEVSKYS